MTPEERAEAVRAHGYRDPLDPAAWQLVGAIVGLTVASPFVGLFLLVVGPGAGTRLGGLVAIVGGTAACWWARSYFRRPVAPLRDVDLEREIRLGWREPR